MLNQLIRKFQIGSLVLDDPSPTMSISEVHEVHCKQYPTLRSTTLFNSDGVIGEVAGETCILFTYVMPPASVNG